MFLIQMLIVFYRSILFLTMYRIFLRDIKALVNLSEINPSKSRLPQDVNKMEMLTMILIINMKCIFVERY